ncbi:uncharacterized protein METZ01_LOCUS174203, partial [marine metagenome]
YRILHDPLRHRWGASLPGGVIGVHHSGAQVLHALCGGVRPNGRLRRL